MKNINPLRTARRKAQRLAKLLAKPGDPPICLGCGCSEPMLLRPITKPFFETHRRFFEEHHVFGWRHDSITTLALCFNCHALVTQGLFQAGVTMKREQNPLKFAKIVFRAMAVHLRMLSDACWRFESSVDQSGVQDADNQ
jgi:hypothetical protein